MKYKKLLLTLACGIFAFNSYSQALEFDGNAIMKNNKSLYFKNSVGGTDGLDGTGIIRASGNALKINYAINSLIFNSLSNKSVLFKDKDDIGIVKIGVSPSASSYFNSTGNFGIGTNNPETNLHIQGTPWSGIKIKDVTTSGGRGIRNDYLDGNNDGWRMLYGGHYTGQPLSFYPMSGGNAGNAIFSLSDNGNVGIGTTTPQNKLSVKGTIWAQEVKVSMTDGADWVFEDDYELKSLEEVETFVNTNKHLPDVPSADEFRENDLNVAEMDNLLLQKVEELTLYMIEMNKQMKVQSEEIQFLKAKNTELESRIK